MREAEVKRFQKTILDWHKKYGRHSLPWRKTRDPYKILVSELMLQQTQVLRVIPKYKSFLRKFPTARALAKASVLSILKEWQGLGYNRRALFLKRTADAVVKKYKGIFPKNVSELESLPGIGAYTARAVSVFAWNKPEAFIETNIRRIFIHFFFSAARKKISDSDIMPYVEASLLRKNPRLWYSALMDYGSEALKHIKNPNRKSRHHMKQSKFEGSSRYARSKLLQYLLYKERATFGDIRNFFSDAEKLEAYHSKEAIQKLLDEMAEEGFLYCRDGKWMVSPL